MFKLHVPAALAITLLSVSPLQDPIPPASPFAVPDGPLPWALPIFPSTTMALTTPSFSFDSIAHTSSFADLQTEMEDRAALVGSEMNQLAADIDSWIGVGGALPDISSGELSDTGLDPNNTGSMTFADYQTQLTSDIVTVFSYGRIAQSIGLAFLVNLFITIFVSLSWQLLVRYVIFVVQLFDGAVALFEKLKAIVFFFAP